MFQQASRNRGFLRVSAFRLKRDAIWNLYQHDVVSKVPWLQGIKTSPVVTVSPGCGVPEDDRPSCLFTRHRAEVLATRNKEYKDCGFSAVSFNHGE